MRTRDLPELGVVNVATPCSEDWEQLRGDEVRRYCARCQHWVYNFASMISGEARALLDATGGGGRGAGGG